MEIEKQFTRMTLQRITPLGNDLISNGSAYKLFFSLSIISPVSINKIRIEFAWIFTKRHKQMSKKWKYPFQIIALNKKMFFFSIYTLTSTTNWARCIWLFISTAKISFKLDHGIVVFGWNCSQKIINFSRVSLFHTKQIQIVLLLIVCVCKQKN